MSARAPSRRAAAGPSAAERSIADALSAIDYLRATLAADAGMLREILARRDRDAATLAKIRAELEQRLASRPAPR